jgi:ribonuclease P protein subunit RPR2
VGTLRVIIGHDDPRLRAAARAVVAEAAGLELVDACDLAGLLAVCERHGPDVAVVAIGAGRTLCTRIGIPVVALTSGSGPLAQIAVEVGARGLLAETELAELPAIVRRVVETRDVAVGSSIASRLVGELLTVHDQTLDANAALELAREAIAAQLDEMRATYRSTVEVLTNAVELRDEYTGGHVRRVSEYSIAMARCVAPSLTDEPFLFGYMLHDIGKLAIPDAVLLKPGALTDAEYELVKTHTTLGARYIERIPFLLPALAVVRSHHERWDGGGYPDGLTGEAIPLIARVFTVADSLDAMTTDRPYRSARSLEHALDEFDRCAGTQFDPAVVRALRWVVERDDAFAALRAGEVPGRERQEQLAR